MFHILDFIASGIAQRLLEHLGGRGPITWPMKSRRTLLAVPSRISFKPLPNFARPPPPPPLAPAFALLPEPALGPLDRRPVLLAPLPPAPLPALTLMPPSPPPLLLLPPPPWPLLPPAPAPVKGLSGRLEGLPKLLSARLLPPMLPAVGLSGPATTSACDPTLPTPPSPRRPSPSPSSSSSSSSLWSLLSSVSPGRKLSSCKCADGSDEAPTARRDHHRVGGLQRCGLAYVHVTGGGVEMQFKK